MILTVWVCLWGEGGGGVITIHSLKFTNKIYPGTEFNLRKIVPAVKSPWKLTWRSWWSFRRVMTTCELQRLVDGVFSNSWSIISCMAVFVGRYRCLIALGLGTLSCVLWGVWLPCWIVPAAHSDIFRLGLVHVFPVSPLWSCPQWCRHNSFSGRPLVYCRSPLGTSWVQARTERPFLGDDRDQVLAILRTRLRSSDWLR